MQCFFSQDMWIQRHLFSSLSLKTILLYFYMQFSVHIHCQTANKTENKVSITKKKKKKNFNREPQHVRSAKTFIYSIYVVRLLKRWRKIFYQPESILDFLIKHCNILFLQCCLRAIIWNHCHHIDQFFFIINNKFPCSCSQNSVPYWALLIQFQNRTSYVGIFAKSTQVMKKPISTHGLCL